MESESAVKYCRAVGTQLDQVRVELLAAGDIEWTGRAACAYAAMLGEALHSLGRLRGSADVALQAVRRHAAATQSGGGGCT